MHRWSVGIIGGGPGSLMLAHRLQNLADVPFSTTIFEAGGRLGGKVLTKRFCRAPVQYEAGAAELYDYSVAGVDPLRELIAELGLSTKPMGGSTVILDDRMLSSAEDIRDELGPATWEALQQFDRRAKDWMSPREFYGSDWYDANGDPQGRQSFQSVLAGIPDAAARRFVQTMVHSDLATEPRLTNGSYGLQNYLMNDPAYMQLYTIDGGIERLTQELIKRIEATVLLDEPVQRVERTPEGKMCITSQWRGESFEREFDFVVAALPNNLLPTIDWGGQNSWDGPSTWNREGYSDGQDLAAAMRRHHSHYNYPAHYLRVSILFQKPFWRNYIQESYFMLDSFGGCCLYDESSRNGDGTYGVLGWLLGGEPASKLSHYTDEELIPLMLDSLPAFLKHGRADFLEGCVHRWVGAVNGLPSGYPARILDTRHQPEPKRHPNFFVVGDYLFDSTLNGVLDSADYVAEWLVVEMEEPSFNGDRNLNSDNLISSGVGA